MYLGGYFFKIGMYFLFNKKRNSHLRLNYLVSVLDEAASCGGTAISPEWNPRSL